MSFISIHDLPAVNASLNAIATLLLLTGYVLIRRHRELAHRRVMLAAFGVSVLFLACYLVYHLNTKAFRTFTGPPPISYAYVAMLVSHIILAAAVPFLAIASIALGLADRRVAHRRLSRWTYPIWLYVSITGVLIYLALYHVYPAPAANPIIAIQTTE